MQATDILHSLVALILKNGCILGYGNNFTYLTKMNFFIIRHREADPKYESFETFVLFLKHLQLITHLKVHCS